MRNEFHRFNRGMLGLTVYLSAILLLGAFITGAKGFAIGILIGLVGQIGHYVDLRQFIDKNLKK